MMPSDSLRSICKKHDSELVLRISPPRFLHAMFLRLFTERIVADKETIQVPGWKTIGPYSRAVRAAGIREP
jgi:hypothetical protein